MLSAPAETTAVPTCKRNDPIPPEAAPINAPRPRNLRNWRSPRLSPSSRRHNPCLIMSIISGGCSLCGNRQSRILIKVNRVCNYLARASGSIRYGGKLHRLFETGIDGSRIEILTRKIWPAFRDSRTRKRFTVPRSVYVPAIDEKTQEIGRTLATEYRDNWTVLEISEEYCG